MNEDTQKIFPNKKRMIIWILSILPIILVVAVYTRLPQQIPTNWGFDGKVSYGEKGNLWILAGISPFLAIMYQVLPKIDPKRKNYRKFQEVYESFQLFMQVFLFVMVGIVIIESFRPGTVQVSTVVCAMCGILFIIIGNMMPKFRQNFFIGFRTPWTLTNEQVWNKTHRLAGRLMFVAGILGLIGAFFPSDKVKMVFLFVPLIAATVIPYIMSYVWCEAYSSFKK
ncbi:MAG: DUF1648 domain-containing protein [Hungatella sp.]|nr:DUF1648 domain-containing protein [Hungatella sp.]